MLVCTTYVHTWRRRYEEAKDGMVRNNAKKCFFFIRKFFMIIFLSGQAPFVSYAGERE
jgi:hypothetical protein